MTPEKLPKYVVLIRWGGFRLELIGRVQILAAAGIVGALVGIKLLHVYLKKKPHLEMKISRDCYTAHYTAATVRFRFLCLINRVGNRARLRPSAPVQASLSANATRSPIT